MERKPLSSHTTPSLPLQAVPVPPASEAEPVIEELTTALAHQGLFGKLKIGASVLLFGEANIDADDTSH